MRASTSIRALLLLSLLAPGLAFAQQQPPATRPGNGIAVREWLILVSDPFQPQASATTLFRDALPDFIDSRRPRAPINQRNQPAPVGVIRISAPAQMRLDVQLDARNGQVVSTQYPSPGRAPGTAHRPYTFRGSYRDPLTFPRRSVGIPLTLRVVVKVAGKGTIKLDKRIRVRT